MAERKEISVIFDWLFKRKRKKSLTEVLENSEETIEKFDQEENADSSAFEKTLIELSDLDDVEKPVSDLPSEEIDTYTPVEQCDEDVSEVLLMATSETSNEIFRTIPHKSCAADAQPDFPSDCTEISTYETLCESSPDDEMNQLNRTDADNPFGIMSELTVIKNDEIQQVIPIQQAIIHESEEDDLPFGTPAIEQENVQEIFMHDNKSMHSEVIVSEEDPVAPGFTVLDGVIVHTVSEKIIKDESIERLNLSVRPYNELKRGGISTLSQLVSLKMAELKKIRNLGENSLTEILKTLDRFLTEKLSSNTLLTNDEKNETSVVIEESAEFIHLNPSVENMPLSVRARNCLQRNGIYDLKSLLETEIETLMSFRNLGLKTLNEIIAFKDGQEGYYTKLVACGKEIEQKRIKAENKKRLKSALFDALYYHALFSYDRDGLYRMFKSYESIEMLDDVLAELLNEGKIEKGSDGCYRLKCIPVLEYARTELNASEQKINILQERVNGKTLEAIAESYGITRERVRQQQNNIVHAIDKKSKIEKQMLHEETFRYLFEHYDICKELFCEITGEPSQTYRFLDLSGKLGSESLDNIVSDENIPEYIKIKWEHYLRFSHQSPFIYIEDDSNRRVKKERIEIERYILSEFCRNEVTFEEFVAIYNDFLHAQHLEGEKKLQLTEAEMRGRKNHFGKCEYVLWKQGEKLRYYPISSQDYTELFEELSLNQYQNIEISTLKLFRQHSDIMEQYDIRDEHELHNLLKKVGIQQENPTAEFGRQPYIRFGEFDRDAMIKEKLFEYAPISKEMLAKAISEEYGYQPAQVMIWFICIKEYFRDGLFSVDYQPLPDEHMALLKEELTDDFYYIHEIKSIYNCLVPGADEELISSFNLTRMGFLVNSNYVIQNFDSAAKYFEHLLTADDIVDIAPFNKRYSTLQMYYSILSHLRDSLQIIEYESYQYIHIRRLQKQGVTKKELKQYCDAVFERVETDSYFTVEALQKSGFADKLDRLGFVPWFYSSVLRVDKRFRFTKLGGTVLFYKGNVQPNLQSFLVDMLHHLESVELDEFLELLEDNYGMKFDKDRVKYAIADTGLYYDSIMKTIYRDYDTYYRTIVEIDDEE